MTWHVRFNVLSELTWPVCEGGGCGHHWGRDQGPGAGVAPDERPRHRPSPLQHPPPIIQHPAQHCTFTIPTLHAPSHCVSINSFLDTLMFWFWSHAIAYSIVRNYFPFKNYFFWILNANYYLFHHLLFIVDYSEYSVAVLMVFFKCVQHTKSHEMVSWGAQGDINYRAANDPSVFTIPKKAPTRALPWLVES